MLIELSPGASFAGYQIEALVGRGGMGVVYRAFDSSLERLVALKLLAPELAGDERFRERFLRETRLAASIEHPHVLPVHAAGEHEACLYLATRYVEGEDLKTRLAREGAVAPEEALRILAELASALDAAHERGLVHRDVKPSNVLLDRAGNVYLADFGLTKTAAAQDGLTRTGELLGTVDYMAPEQLRGGPIDHRVDVYAFACLAFESLSGGVPFGGEGDAQVLWAHLNEPPPSLHERRPDLPEAIDQVFARALAKDAAERYGSCGAFAQAMQAALAPRRSGSPRGSAAPAGLAEERKLVTVLACSVIGGTEPAAAADPERLRRLGARFAEAVAEVVGRHGGVVESRGGDAVLAVFGVPALHEDDAARALRAALELRDAGVALRGGVSTGEVVTGDPAAGEALVTGQAVGLAVQLEQAAATGEILVGERTVAIAPGAFELEEIVLGGRGAAADIRARRLVRALAVDEPRGKGGLHPAFVGRESELDLLEASYRRAVRDREPQLVTILGDPGVGKSRVVRELWERLRSSAPEPLWARGRCLSYGRGVTYWPLGEILKAHLGILESDSPETVRERLGDRAILGLTLGLGAPELHPLLARERLREAWADLLGELVAERPAVVVLEDLHWAEDPLLDLVERLARDVRGPLLLITTARPELLDRRPAWSGGRRNSALLSLEPLAADETAGLLAKLLGVELPPGLSRLLVERAEGSPFFLEELLAVLIDRGVLEPADGRWLARDVPTDLALPDSVQTMLAARIDLLEPRERAALQAAAVIGRVFWAGPVQELTGGEEANFDLLEERDFVRRQSPSSMVGELELAFKHAVTHEVAYAGLPRARRARLHAAFAEWLERIGKGRDEHAPLLAHHYAEAVRPEHADLAWEDEDRAEELRATAVVWLRRAAELAAGRYAIDEQIGLLHRAVELEAGDEAQAELWLAIARASALTFSREGFREAMERAIVHSTDDVARAELLSELAFEMVYRWGRGDYRELVEGWIDESLRLARAGSPARVRALIAGSYCWPAEADRLAREAYALVEHLDEPELRAAALHARQHGAFFAGDYHQAARFAEERLGLLRRLGDPDQLADGYWSAIPTYAALGGFAEARQNARLHDDVTRGLTTHHRLHGVAATLEVEELAGNWEGIRELTPRTERAVEENTTVCVHNPRALLLCALASACLGDKDEANRLEQRADSLGEEEYGRAFEVRVRLGLLRNYLGTVERLLAASERPERPLRRSMKLAPVAARLDALAALCRSEEVEAEAPPLLVPGTYLEPFALRALGRVRRDGALMDQAAVSFEAMGLNWHASETRRWLAGSLG